MALSAKHQQFANRIIAGDSATAAYCHVYGCDEKVGGANGHRLLKKAEIAAYVAARLQKAAEKADLTLVDHLAELGRLRDAAALEKQYSAATTAEVSRGRASGFYVDKTKVEHTGAVQVFVRVQREGKRATAS